jgi:hypothetical protein
VNDFSRKNIEFSIIFECVGRLAFLKERIEKSHGLMKDFLDTDNFVGFYSYAEIGASKKLPASSHTYTCSSITFSNELVSENGRVKK